MNSGKISIRYARALYMSAKEHKKEDAIYKEIAAMGETFDRIPDVHTALTSPTVTEEEKMELLLAVAGKDASAEIQNFIKFVVEERREEYMPSIARMYEQIYRKENNIVISTLTSASELSESALSSVRKYVSRLCGSSNVEIRSKIDDGLIGGFVLDINSSRLDASIKGQLNALKYYAGH